MNCDGKILSPEEIVWGKIRKPMACCATVNHMAYNEMLRLPFFQVDGVNMSLDHLFKATIIAKLSLFIFIPTLVD